MSCRRFERTVFLVVGAANDWEFDDVTREHLESCPRCRARLSGVQQLRISVRVHCGRVPAPPTLSERIRALLETL